MMDNRTHRFPFQRSHQASINKRRRKRLNQSQGRQSQFEMLESRRMLTVASDPVHDLATVVNPVEVKIGIIDAGDRDDLVVLGADGSITVALNGDDNHWAARQTTNLGLGPLNGMEVTLVNADPFADLVVQGPNSVHYLKGDATGQFVLTDSISPGAPGTLASSSTARVGLDAGFLNTDFASDLVSVVPETDELLVFVGDGSDRLPTPARYASGADEPIVARIADVIGSPIPDVVVGHADGTVTWFEGLGDGTLAFRSDLMVTGLDPIFDLTIDDFDGDGDNDVSVSGGTEVNILAANNDAVAISPIANGDFSAGLTGWETEIVGHADGATPGRVNAQGNFVQFHENESFLVSLRQTFQVPPSPQTISLDIESLGLESPAGGVPDAFEVSLLAADLASFVPAHSANATSFFNANPGGAISTAPGVSFDGRTLTVDISSIPAGTQATLYLDLVGNPPGTSSVVSIDNVRISPETVRNDATTTIALPGPFLAAAGIAHGDVDGDGYTDIVVADSSANKLIVYNGDGLGGFTRSEIDTSTRGTSPLTVAIGQLTAADSIADIAATMYGSSSVITPLTPDLEIPTAMLTDPVSPATTPVTQVTLGLSEPVRNNGPTGTHSVTNPAAYHLVNTYDNATIPVTSITYNSTTNQAVLQFGANPLPDGIYTLTIEGDDPNYSLEDLSGNLLGDGIDQTFTFTVNAVGPSGYVVYDLMRNEGQQIDYLASFADPGATGGHSATIDWGDGSTSTGTIAFVDGLGTITAEHTYADNGVYTATVTVTDSLDRSNPAASTHTILNVNPTVTPANDVEVFPGESLNLTVGTFLDPGFSNATAGTSETFTATLNWGDGSSIDSVDPVVTQGSPGVATTGSIPGSHTYTLDGTYTVTISVHDDDSGSTPATATFLVTVANPVPEILSINNLSGAEGQSISLGAEFDDFGDPGPHQAIVNWGDGTTTNAQVTFASGIGTITDEHTYADNGAYTVEIRVVDSSDNQGTATTQASIINIAPTRIMAADQTVDEGVLFNGNLATFSDPGFSSLAAGTQESFSAMVDWGDGTSESATVTFTPGGPGQPTTGTVSGQHTYANQGNFVVSVTLADDDQDGEIGVLSVTVNNAAPDVTAIDPISSNEGAIVEISTTFTDPGALDSHTALIHWGDGSSSTASLDAETKTVSGNHVYADNGSYTIIVEFTDNDLGEGSTSTTATIANVAPSLTVPSNREIRAGMVESIVVGTFSDPGFTSVTAGTGETFTATINWGDGSPTETATIEVTPGSEGIATTGFIQGTHSYSALGTYTISFTLSDDDGGTASSSYQVTSIAKFYVVDQSAHKTFRYGGTMGLLSQSDLAAGNSSVRGASTDPLGLKLWVVDASKDIFVYNRSGALLGSWKGQDLNNPRGVANDGTNIYVANAAKDQIHKYNNAVNHLSGTYTANSLITLHSGNANASGLVTDGQVLWIANDKENDPRVFVYSVSGAYLGQWSLDAGNTHPSGITIDAANGDLYVSDRLDGAVYRYSGAANWRVAADAQPASAILPLAAANHNPEGIADPVAVINLGDTVSDAIAVAGEIDEYLFDVTAGETIFFDLQALTASQRLITRLTAPDGTVLWSQSSTIRDNHDFGPLVLSQTGTYVLRIESNGATPSYTFTLVDVPATSSTAITLGPTVNGAISAAGERDQFTFSATAGQPLYFNAITGSSNSLDWRLTDPSGSSIFNDDFEDVGPLTASATGTYTLEVDGVGDDTGSYSFQALLVPAPDETTIQIGDTVSGHIETFLSIDRWYFAGIAGNQIFIDMTALSGTLDYDLFTPSGVRLGGASNNVLSAMDTGPFTLSENGTYQIRMQSGNGTSVPTYTYRLLNVPAPDVAPLIYNTRHDGSIESPGVIDNWTFTGVAGQRLFFDMQANSGGAVEVRLFSPSGSTVFSVTNSVVSAMNSGPFVLPANGAYTLRVDGVNTATTNYGFTLWTVPDPDVHDAQFSQPYIGTIETPGVWDLWEFDVTSGQSVFFDMQMNTGGTLQASLTAPNGAVVFSNSNSIVNILDSGPHLLNQTGTYTLKVDGVDDARADMYQFSLNNVTPPAPIPIPFVTPIPGALDLGGQTFSHTFSGTAGQPIIFDILYRDAIGFSLVSPTNTAIFTNATSDQTIASLPATGTYTIRVDQSGDTTNAFDDTGMYSFRVINGTIPPALPAAADLVVSNVLTPRRVTGNPASIEVTWTVTNQGTGATATGDWVDRIVLSDDLGYRDADDRIVIQFPHSGTLLPGQSYTRTETITLADDLQGDFWVAVTADPLNAVFENQLEHNPIFAPKRTAVYREDRAVTGEASISIDQADGAEFPAGATIVLSGNAEATPGAVNAIFIIDLSGSTLLVTNLDANFDGVVDSRDNINGQNNFADILDVELGSILRVTSQLAGQVDDLLVGVIPFGLASETVDLGHTLFNQTFADPAVNVNGDGAATPDYEEATRSIYNNGTTSIVDRFRAFSFNDNTNFDAAIEQLIGSLEIAPQADKTLVYFLSDGDPTTDPTLADLQLLGESGIQFHAFQITGNAVSAEMQNMASVINAGSNSTGVARLVSDPEDLTAALLATLQIAGVTVNGQSVHAFDSAGNFFTPVAIAPGPNTFTVSAIDSLGNSVERTITLYGVDPAGSAVVQDVTNRAEVGYQATTFNRLTKSLHVEQMLTNSGSSNLRATVTAAVDQISVASVDLTTIDGTLADGRSFVDYDAEFTSGNLPPNATSDQIPLTFTNPDQARFSLDVSLLSHGNRAPFFSSAPPVITSVGTEALYAVAVTDSDGDPIEFDLLTAPDGMTIDAAGLVEWTPATPDAGVHAVRIQASDGHGGTAIQSFHLEVRATLANRPPTFRSLPITRIDSGTDYSYTAEAIDADGHAITYSLPTAPAGMTIHPTSGQVTFNDPADGDYSVTILAVDGFGGQTEQTFVLTVGAVATNSGSPVILSTPVTEAVSGSLYLYLPLAQDPDGDLLSWSLVQSPTGMTIHLTSGRIDWTPTSAQLGPHTVLVKVSDGNGGFATQLYTIEVSAVLGNRAPLITSSPSFLGTQDMEYSYNLTALDLDGDPITFGLVSGPAGLTVSSAGAVRWTPSDSDLGVHRIKLRATDASGASGLQTYDLEIRGPNAAPEFTSTPLLTGFAETIYRYDTDAIDSEDELQFSLLNPPSGMTIDASTGQVVWTPALSDIGSHSIIVRATDDRGLFTDQPYSLTVVIDDVPPVVAVLMTDNVVNLGETIRLELRATDNVSVVSRDLTIDGVVQTLDGLHQVDYTPSTAGIISVVGTATDSAGNIGTGTRTIRVLDPNDTTPPVVEITSPNPGSLPTYLTDILGTATDDNLEFYRLEYSLSGAEQWTTISEQYFRPGPGGTGVVNQNLGAFDPTMLANDSYDIRLMAQDTNGQQSFTRIELYVEAQAKLGNFRLEFTDLNIPLAGIPIQINRIYDTLEANVSGDFGFGWSLGLYTPRIRETVRISAAEQAGVPALFGGNPFRVGTRVYITNPDGRRVGFTFDPVVEGGLLGAIWHPRFTPDPGVYDQLLVKDITLSQRPDGTFGLYLFGYPYNPDEYTLTTKDQHQYRINQFGGLLDVTDRNGVKLTFMDNGVFSSVGESIEWLRDTQGRITEIIDPAGNSIHYTYDASGDLRTVSNQIGDATNMTYFSAPAHYLDRLIDPVGNLLNRTAYDANGRVSATYDALGNPITRTYDLDNNTEVVSDRLGHETVLVFDDRGNITSATDPLGNGILTTYDVNDNEVTVSSSSGRFTTFTYDGRGNVTSESNARGSLWTTTYDAFNNPLTSTLPDGIQTRFGYDSRGNLTSVIDAAGATTGYTVDTWGRITQQVDPRGFVTHFSYSPTKVPTQVTFPDGSIRRVSYNQFQQPTQLTDENGNLTRIEYDATGNPTSVIDALGNIYSYEFTAGRLTRIVDPLGQVREYEYNAAGQRTRETDVDGGVWRYTFDANGNQLSQISPLGHTTRFAYDELGRLTREIDAMGNQSVIEYDVDGNEVAEIDRLGRRTTYEYDLAGNRTKITYPDESTVLMTYDANNLQTSITNESGFATEYEYDGRGRIIRTIDPLGGVHERQFDGSGNVIREIDPTGRVTVLDYDNRNRRSRHVAADGGVTTFGYDPVGNLIRMTDPLGNATLQAYDAMNRSVQRVDPLGGITHVMYDARGNITSETDALGRTEYFSRDYYDRPTSHTDERGFTESWSWDQEGNLVSVTDFSGNVTSYSHDVLGRILLETNPLGHSRQFSYDAEDNRLESIDAIGRRRSFEYDDRDRLVAENWWQGSSPIKTLTFAYDPEGTLLSAADGPIQIVHVRDELGRITSTTNSFTPTLGFDLQYTHDARGLITSVTDGLGVSTSSTYDAAGRLASRTWQGLPAGVTARSEMSYNAAGDMVDLTRFVGTGSTPVLRTQRSYDAKGRLESLTHIDAADTVLADYDFTRNAVDELTGWSHHGQSLSFSYDPTGQLTSTVRNGVPESSYEYDETGNRIDGTNTVGPGNQLSSDSTFDYTYDSEGNLVVKVERTTSDRWEYDYDHRNRLTGVKLYSGGTSLDLEATFQYDALDRRVSRSIDADGSGSASSVTTYFALDGDHVWADLNDTGQVSARYLYGEQVDSLLARWRDADGLSWYLTDHLGSVRDIADSGGAIIDTIEYDAFGNVIAESNPSAGDRFKYTGREREEEIDLYYYRARYYDSSSGRFINPDPIGFLGGDGNLYRYVGNKPLTFTDPTGNTETSEGSVFRSRIVTPLVKGFTCVGKEAVENLPELVLGDATGYVADMGVTVVSCAVNPAAAKTNEFFATLTVKIKGGQILTGTAKLVADKAGGLSRYLLQAFYDCGASALSKGDYRKAGGTPAGQHAHHLVGKKSRFAAAGRKILADCCIGIHSAIGVVNLPPDEHIGVGLHTRANMEGVGVKLNQAKKTGGCAAVARALAEVAKKRGFA